MGMAASQVEPPGFAFGENWSRFLHVVDEARIAEAEGSLRAMLEVEDLRGMSFLDVGCGSGLFSLAAMRLGAERVHAFDVDPDSVACATELKRRYLSGAEDWTIEAGNALDRDYLAGLGRFDVVYAWGVLHHTGDLLASLENVATLPAPGGVLFVSVYNDQGLRSRVWRLVKRVYNTLPRLLHWPYVVAVLSPGWGLQAILNGLKRAARLLGIRLAPAPRPPIPYRGRRGMSRWHDMVDWVGGYPFEVARPDLVFDVYRRHGFTLTRLATTPQSGCNEYVFRRAEAN